LFPHSKRVLGLRNRSSSGPNSTRPAQLWPYACVTDPNCSEPSREGRASACNRAVERRFRAISADWRFWLWGGKTAIYRNGDIELLLDLLSGDGREKSLCELGPLNRFMPSMLLNRFIPRTPARPALAPRAPPDLTFQSLFELLQVTAPWSFLGRSGGAEPASQSVSVGALGRSAKRACLRGSAGAPTDASSKRPASSEGDRRAEEGSTALRGPARLVEQPAGK
jgi:hypothetical protein